MALVLRRASWRITDKASVQLISTKCTDYIQSRNANLFLEVDGKKMDYLPAAVDDQLKAKPIYKNFKGLKNNESLESFANFYFFCI